jgi:hypothetical protein
MKKKQPKFAVAQYEAVVLIKKGGRSSTGAWNGDHIYLGRAMPRLLSEQNGIEHNGKKWSR